MRTFFILLILFFATSCSRTKKITACDKFRTGKFVINYKSRGVKFYIERTNAEQKESNPITGGMVTYDIKWTGDCEYELHKRTVKENVSDSASSQPSGETKNPGHFKVRITETSDMFCVFEIRMQGMDQVFKDTMYRIGGFKSVGEIFPAKK